MRGRVINMKDEHIKNFVKTYLETHVTKNDLVIDATVGNGFDTITLSKLALKVIGFDIQKVAIEKVSKELIVNDIRNVELIHDSFECISQISGYKGVVFNLGYLPNGDKTITTLAETTLKTLKMIVNQMNIHDFILMTAYPGHPEGLKESTLLLDYVKTLNTNYISLTYQIQNRVNAPFVIVIERQK